MTDTADSRSVSVNLAKFISVIFHPLLMPFYGLLIIFTSPTLLGFQPLVFKKYLFMIMLINNLLLPLSLIPYFKYRKLITTWTMENRNERIIPLAITSFFYFITVYIIIKFSIPLFIKSFILSTALLSFAVTLINFKWKISVHSVGSGALIAMILALSVKMHAQMILYLIGAILTGGFVLSSRLKLGAHSPGETWSGFFLGLIVLGTLLLIL